MNNKQIASVNKYKKIDPQDIKVGDYLLFFLFSDCIPYEGEVIKVIKKKGKIIKIVQKQKNPQPIQCALPQKEVEIRLSEIRDEILKGY